MKTLDLLLLTILAALWGASYLFIRIAGPALGSIWLMTVRLAIAAGIILATVGIMGHLPDFRRRWKQFLAIGAIGNAIPFVLGGKIGSLSSCSYAARAKFTAATA